MHIFWKYITGSSLKMLCVGIFVKHTLCSLYWNRRKFCKSERREDNYSNIPMEQSKFSHELTFWFISIENDGKQKSKNTLRVEINFVMANAILWEVLMPSTKFEGLSYPTHFLKSRGIVIRNNFLEYRTKQATLFARRNDLYALFATNKAKPITKMHFSCSCRDTIYCKSIKKNRKKSHFWKFTISLLVNIFQM